MTLETAVGIVVTGLIVQFCAVLLKDWRDTLREERKRAHEQGELVAVLRCELTRVTDAVDELREVVAELPCREADNRMVCARKNGATTHVP